MIEQMLKEVKAQSDPQELGMILIHNGVVRGTSKNGQVIKTMSLTYDEKGLQTLVADFRKKEGIVNIKIWINQGQLNIGDDIMYLLVAGRFRTDIMPVFTEFLSTIKNNILNEDEVL